jgi:hypothetical protein
MKHLWLLLLLLPSQVLAQTHRLTPRTIQPIVYDSAKAATIRASLSPGFRGMTRGQIDQKVAGQYEIRYPNADSSSIRYSPYRFHGLPGVLAVSFDTAGHCRSIFWASHDPDWLIDHSRDTALPLYKSLKSLEANFITEEQYNSLRQQVGLEPLMHPFGPRFLEYWPIMQELRYELGRLVYTEAPSFRPLQKGVFLSGAEPTMDVTTGR